VKILLLATMLSNCLLSYAGDEELKLTRSSNTVIANVWSATSLAACSTTHDFFHATCQLDRGTQKCPSCPCWDVSFLPAVSVARKPVVSCELCSQKIVFTAGFPKSDLS
jgi:hypothetical protein